MRSVVERRESGKSNEAQQLFRMLRDRDRDRDNAWERYKTAKLPACRFIWEYKKKADTFIHEAMIILIFQSKCKGKFTFTCV